MTSMKRAPVTPMLTVSEVAKRMAVSERTVYRWIGDGTLPRHKFGRIVRISERDLNNFIAASYERDK